MAIPVSNHREHCCKSADFTAFAVINHQIPLDHLQKWLNASSLDWVQFYLLKLTFLFKYVILSLCDIILLGECHKVPFWVLYFLVCICSEFVTFYAILHRWCLSECVLLTSNVGHHRLCCSLMKMQQNFLDLVTWTLFTPVHKKTYMIYLSHALHLYNLGIICNPATF